MAESWYHFQFSGRKNIYLSSKFNIIRYVCQELIFINIFEEKFRAINFGISFMAVWKTACLISNGLKSTRWEEFYA